LIIAAIGLALPGGKLSAQTAPAKPVSSNRFLLIVQTSRSMQRRTDAVLRAAQDLLLSGMNGQFRRGDTLGVWTFNDELHAGEFPLQPWTPDTSRAVAIRALTFLKDQKYEKSTRLDKVLPSLYRVIKDSDFITVILITDGTEPIKGTPFDDGLNKIYRDWRQEQQKARMPFVTVLRGRAGQLTNGSATPAPWPVELPPLPVEPRAIEAVTPPPAAPPKPEPRPTVPPLIIIGKKPEAAQPSTPPMPPASEPSPPAVAPAVAIAAPQTEPAPAPAQPVEEPKPVATAVQPIISAPPALPTPPAEPKVSEPVQPSKPEAALSKPVLTLVAPPLQPAPTPEPVAEPPKVETAPSPPPKPAEPSAATQPAAPAPITLEAVKPVVVAQPAQTPAPAPLVTTPGPRESKPAKPAIPPKTEARPPAAVASAAKTKPPAINPPAAAPVNREPAPKVAVRNPQPKTMPVQTAVATPPMRLSWRTGVLLAGLVLLLVVSGLWYMLTRRPRTTEQASLITRSLDRDKK